MIRRVIDGVTTSGKSKEPLFNSNGILNASNKKDALQQLAKAIQLLSSSDDLSTMDKNTREYNESLRKDRYAELSAAFADKSNTQLEMLGNALAAQIEETTDRMGFCRQLLIPSELQQGDYPEVTVKYKNVMAHVMSSAAQVVPTEVREKRLVLNEFDVSVHLLMEQRELNRARTDLLEEKYEEGLEAIMVTEDRYWKKLAEASAQSRHNIQTTTNFTPQFFARMRDIIDREGIPVATCIMASTLMKDIITGTEFQHVFDPVTQREILETGQIGTLYNTVIYSDHVRQKEFRVLEDGEFFLVGSPQYHGVILTRPLNSTPIDRAAFGETKKGWFMTQGLSMAVINNKSVVKGQRI